MKNTIFRLSVSQKKSDKTRATFAQYLFKKFEKTLEKTF